MRADRLPLADRLLRALSRDPSTPLTTPQLAVRLDTSPDAVRVTLHRLLQQQRVEQTPPPDGGRTVGYRPRRDPAPPILA